MDHAPFLASDGTRDVARCTAFVNRRFQQSKGEAVGFIGHFAAADSSPGPVRAMIARAEAWLVERGVSRIVGPYNGAAALGMGLLAAAHDEDPTFPLPWQPASYSQYFLDNGYRPTYPLWYYDVDFSSEKYRKAKQAVKPSAALCVRPINKKRWDEDLETLRLVFNEAFSEEWEFHPMTTGEFAEFFGAMKPIIDPQQVLLAEVNGATAGFCFGLPDWTPLFRSFQGKLGPWQLLKLMLGSGKYTRAGLLGIGVLPQHKGSGLAHALAMRLYARYEQKGLTSALYYPVNESNHRSRRFAESLGGTGQVMYRVFDKVVAANRTVL